VPERKHALGDFYYRYKADALVIDKWFAAGHHPAAEYPRKCAEPHCPPAFSLANPNRVRALIGAFAQGNATQFNRS
jgi:aminopeptidase N